jgi:hypothetical protein
MFRTHYLLAAIGLALLVAACADDAAPPSAPGAEPTLRTAVRAQDSTAHFRFQIRRVGAEASFSSIDPSGCVETDAFVFGAEQTQKEGPGKPTTGPLAFVSLFEFNFCTNEVLRSAFGVTNDAVFEAERNKLTEARLQATITAFDDLTGAEVQVEVDVAWTGTGVLTSQSDRFRLKQPGLLVTQWFKGTFRESAASGTVAVGGENLATDAASFADIFRARFGELDVVKTR